MLFIYVHIYIMYTLYILYIFFLCEFIDVLIMGGSLISLNTYSTYSCLWPSGFKAADLCLLSPQLGSYELTVVNVHMQASSNTQEVKCPHLSASIQETLRGQSPPVRQQMITRHHP